MNLTEGEPLFPETGSYSARGASYRLLLCFRRARRRASRKRELKLVQKSVAATVAFVVGIAGPVYAKTTVIASLGHAPLLGHLASTPQMQREVREHFKLLKRTAARLGITPQQYEDFRIAVATGDVRWVEIPRHLDAMSWGDGHDSHVIHDVMIPAHTHGWEVDLPSGDHILALYMPAACGNLATLRKPAPPRLAVAPQVVPPPPPPVAPSPVPTPTIDTPPPPAKKGAPLWGFFLGLLGAGVGIGASTGGGDMPCP